MEGLGKAWGWHAYATVFRYITYLTQIYKALTVSEASQKHMDFQKNAEL